MRAQKMTLVTLSTVLFFALAACGVARTITGQGEGYYVRTVVEQVDLADGSSIQRILSEGFLVAADPSNPFHQNAQDCIGTGVFAADGSIISQAGYCHGTDEDGDMCWLWFSGDQDAGRWGFLSGTGKYEGASGGGTFTAGVVTPDGKAHNSWEGSWEMK